MYWRCIGGVLAVYRVFTSAVHQYFHHLIQHHRDYMWSPFYFTGNKYNFIVAVDNEITIRCVYCQSFQFTIPPRELIAVFTYQ